MKKDRLEQLTVSDYQDLVDEWIKTLGVRYFSELTNLGILMEEVGEVARIMTRTYTLHKPHVATHRRQDFIDTNITGTLNLLEEAVSTGISSFIYTSTTSTFGDALTPSDDNTAAWITEDVIPVPKNIYGVTKVAAENLCQLFYRNNQLPCIILRTSRFFPEEDDRKEVREGYEDSNAKSNEFLFRRVDIEDIGIFQIQDLLA